MSYPGKILNNLKEFEYERDISGNLLSKTFIIDEKRTIRAKPANIAHKLDSDIVNYLIGEEGMELYSIHDMFIGDLNISHKLIDKLNEYYHNKLNYHNKTYSIFILK